MSLIESALFLIGFSVAVGIQGRGGDEEVSMSGKGIGAGGGGIGYKLRWASEGKPIPAIQAQGRSDQYTAPLNTLSSLVLRPLHPLQWRCSPFSLQNTVGSRTTSCDDPEFGMLGTGRTTLSPRVPLKIPTARASPISYLSVWNDGFYPLLSLTTASRVHSQDHPVSQSHPVLASDDINLAHL